MNLEVTEMPSASAYAKGRPVSRKIQHRAINVGERRSCGLDHKMRYRAWSKYRNCDTHFKRLAIISGPAK